MNWNILFLVKVKIPMNLLLLLISLMTVIAVFSIDDNSDIQSLWNQFKVSFQELI